jgi:hypothetical protein
MVGSLPRPPTPDDLGHSAAGRDTLKRQNDDLATCRSCNLNNSVGGGGGSAPGANAYATMPIMNNSASMGGAGAGKHYHQQRYQTDLYATRATVRGNNIYQTTTLSTFTRGNIMKYYLKAATLYIVISNCSVLLMNEFFSFMSNLSTGGGIWERKRRGKENWTEWYANSVHIF